VVSLIALLVFWSFVVYIEQISTLFDYLDRDQVELPDICVQYVSKKQTFRPVFGESVAELFERIELSTSESALPAFLHRTITFLHKFVHIEGTCCGRGRRECARACC